MKKSFLFFLISCAFCAQAQTTSSQAPTLVKGTELGIHTTLTQTGFPDKARDLNPVQNLSAEVLEEGTGTLVNLSWDYPEGYGTTETATISWSGDAKADEVGLYASGPQEAAQRFTASDMAPYVGWRVNAIQMSVWHQGIENNYESVHVWKGTNQHSLETVGT